MAMSEPAAIHEGRFIDAGSVRTFCLEAGDGPPLVLLHGCSVAIDSRVTWFRTIDALADHFRVIAFDQVGFGHTDIPAGGFPGRLDRTRHAIDVLDALGIGRAILVGHSEGGFMATRIAIEQPERVSKLVVVTSGGTSPPLGDGRDEAWLAASRAAYDVTAMDNEPDFMTTAKHVTHGRDPVFMAMLRTNYAHARQSGNLDMFRHAPKGNGDPLAYVRLQEEHIHPFLPALAVPTLLVWAADDETVPVARGQRLMELFRDGTLHVIDGAKHMVMIDQADRFNRLLLDWCGAP